MASLSYLPPRTPKLAQFIAGMSFLFITMPIVSLLGRVPWAELTRIVAEPVTQQMLLLSLAAAAQSTAIAVILGVPMAVALQGFHRGANMVRVFVLLPLAMPPVVAGLALSAFAGYHGLLSPLLQFLHLNFAFTFSGVVMAHVFITLPFVIVTVDAALRQLDKEIVYSAATLGMSPFRITSRIVLPAISGSVATGAGLAFARSLGEFGTTLTFAGSLPGVTRTLPLGIYLERETNQERAYALAFLLITLAVIVLCIASLPFVIRRPSQPRPHRLGKLDAHRLRTLSKPSQSGPEIHCGDIIFPGQEVSAVIGENGSGKSTLAATIAGRIRDSQRLIGVRRQDSRLTWIDRMPSHRRGIILLSQNPGLPPHRTVLTTLSMVNRDKKYSLELLSAAGLSDLASTLTTELSGGQAAQVALLRALSTRPQALILDEPLAAVDNRSASRWRHLLRAVAEDRTTILISHNPVDIASLSQHLVILDKGECVAQGSTNELLTYPPDDFSARIAGLNRIEGEITSVEQDLCHIVTENLDLFGINDSGEDLGLGHKAVAIFSPESVMISTDLRAHGDKRYSPRNHWICRVSSTYSHPGSTLVTLFLDPLGIQATITQQALIELHIREGTEVIARAKASSVRIFPRHHRQS
ncbi:ATP-binding cassette domain-containing protein [Corynebacterium sp. 3HC-13]|uniref:ATP-binding cassette domain-containing protein n=1 Tax=Corynebacterium poyangense TaxID=2684405 RepID=UPI001CCE16D6|nr:ATP-binding cassette domain-containing protein [Corynebacterium poyangense]MBZ8177065.1 ATP-binding cassette domain-containing protein [Corynebacterium poyangense]